MTTKTLPVGNKVRQKGFTYLVMLGIVVVLGIMAEVGVLLQSKVALREKENELLFRGMAYQKAIQSYYEAGKTVKSYPRNLQDLVRDPRFSNKRHIRELYTDPMTGGEWLLVKDGDNIVGVASPSQETPNKIANFPPDLEGFKNARHYSDWLFTYTFTFEKVKRTDTSVN